MTQPRPWPSPRPEHASLQGASSPGALADSCAGLRRGADAATPRQALIRVLLDARVLVAAMEQDQLLARDPRRPPPAVGDLGAVLGDEHVLRLVGGHDEKRVGPRRD